MTPQRPARVRVSHRTHLIRRAVAIGTIVIIVAAIAGYVSARDGGSDGADADSAGSTKPHHTTSTARAELDAAGHPVLSPTSGVGKPWGGTVDGLLTFRGNPTRTYYGQGPVPKRPGIDWYYPASGGMCSASSAKGVTKTWCGAGWTGQPAVFEHGGRTWVVFGAYDRAVHFMDAKTGEEILPPFPTGDIIKGSVTVDPDGYPLIYIGSRDNYFRVIALDRPGRAVELWKLSATAVSPTLWNNDWDGSGLVLDDMLIEGGENSQLHVVKLGRATGADGLATVDPKLIFHTPGWDAQVIRDLAGNRDHEMSIEDSTTVFRDTVYFANSGGLVQGWDLAPLRSGGTPTRTFRYWTGDDTDAAVVVDEHGDLYVGVEYERANDRAKEVGQILKLDPSKPDDPVVWKIDDQGSNPAGVWSTMALDRDVVYATTNGGRLMGIDRNTGEVRWTKHLPGPVWQSPVVVDHVLIEGDCSGVLHGYDVADTRQEPRELWRIDLGGCIEATPAVWKGRVYFATRAGRFFALSDSGRKTSPTAGDARGSTGE